MDKYEKTVYFMVTKMKYSFYRINIEVCIQSTAISFSKEEKVPRFVFSPALA
jgi:hypothetical protein